MLSEVLNKGFSLVLKKSSWTGGIAVILKLFNLVVGCKWNQLTICINWLFEDHLVVKKIYIRLFFSSLFCVSFINPKAFLFHFPTKHPMMMAHEQLRMLGVSRMMTKPVTNTVMVKEFMNKNCGTACLLWSHETPATL